MGTSPLPRILMKKKIYVELRVKDNGPGISDQIKDQIFLPFVTTKEEKGTGLGLYLCRNIVEKHQGKIFYNKDFKHGTEFVVRFPLGKKG